MQKIVIDGSSITSKEQLHQLLQQQLKLPDYYGGNLDALWDCLTCDVELPVEIEWRDYEQTRKQLGDYADRMVQTFKAAEKESHGKLRFTIK
ncbi:barstar family protein [Paenibacillus sp. 481]|uniref:barstar family protein n=1 Tax=Paenibacillus sp. 481 TaxID=2835869 RepID=UPI001E424DAD|nr:barstar family protein [Paenibacillus sp. 481]UHA75500.1 barstar family protein [Paenibacillus sp. 481]